MYRRILDIFKIYVLYCINLFLCYFFFIVLYIVNFKFRKIVVMNYMYGFDVDDIVIIVGWGIIS